MRPRERLARHLESWLGAWPPSDPGITVVGSTRRTEPGWDGRIRLVAGVATPEGAILSVPPSHAAAVREIASDFDSLFQNLPTALGLPEWSFHQGVFRWSEEPADSDDPGTWLPPDAPVVPEWLRPFNGDVLVAFSHGRVAGGVGRKIHDRYGHELAVVTEPDHRGQGWATRLVAQAGRRVLEEGAVPTYLHGAANEASARTADAAGFPDRGWRILGLFPGRPS